MRKEGEVRIYLALSTIGLLMMLCLPLIGSTGELYLWQRAVVAALLLACNAMGASMAFRPNWSSGCLRIGARPEEERPSASKPFVGHHPDCPTFADHVLVIGGRRLCAGCLGLGAGCLLCIPLVSIVLLDRSQVAPLGGALLVAGVVLVGMNLFESIHGPRSVWSHVLLNALFPLAFLLITLGALTISGELMNGIWAILLSLLWIETRKVISRDHHAAICSECPSTCKSFTR